MANIFSVYSFDPWVIRDITRIIKIKKSKMQITKIQENRGKDDDNKDACVDLPWPRQEGSRFEIISLFLFFLL